MKDPRSPMKTWKQDVWPWLKIKLDSVALVLGLIATVVGLLTVVIGLYLEIKTTAQSAVLDDPQFLERLSEQVRPVCLLSSKGYFYEDYGALAFIDSSLKIEFATDSETVSFIIHAKRFLRQPPIISSVDGSLYLISVQRETTDSWRYTFGAVFTHFDASMGYHQIINTNADHLFKVEVLH